MIIAVPHRDLYEKKLAPPSRWNRDHKYFFLPDRNELPSTLGLLPILKVALKKFQIEYIKVCSEGHTITDPLIHDYDTGLVDKIWRYCLMLLSIFDLVGRVEHALVLLFCFRFFFFAVLISLVVVVKDHK